MNREVKVSICMVTGELLVTMRLIAGLEEALEYDNFFKFFEGVSGKAPLPLRAILNAGEYLLQELGVEHQEAALLVSEANADIVAEVLAIVTQVIEVYAQDLSVIDGTKEKKAPPKKSKIEATPWNEWEKVCCGMIGWSPYQFWNSRPKDALLAIEGFKQFHCSSDDKGENIDNKKTTSLYEHY